MLSNAYLLAKFRFDTAENEQNFAEILPKTDNYSPARWTESSTPSASRRRCAPRWRRPSKIEKIGKKIANFAKFWRARSRLYRSQILQQQQNSLESSRRDLHNALLYTALKSHFSKKLLEFCQKIAKFFKI